jgi:hypothetical protein
MRSNAEEQPDGNRILRNAGYRTLARLACMDPTTVKANLDSLTAKLAIQKVRDETFVRGADYLIFSYRNILQRRQEKGLLWVRRTRGVAFVPPPIDAQREGESPTVGDSPPVGGAHIGGVGCVPTVGMGAAPTHQESKNERGRKRASADRESDADAPIPISPARPPLQLNPENGNGEAVMVALRELTEIQRAFPATQLGRYKPPDAALATRIVQIVSPANTAAFFQWVAWFKFKEQGRYPGRANGPNTWGLFVNWAEEFREWGLRANYEETEPIPSRSPNVTDQTMELMLRNIQKYGHIL